MIEIGPNLTEAIVYSTLFLFLSICAAGYFSMMKSENCECHDDYEEETES